MFAGGGSQELLLSRSDLTQVSLRFLNNLLIPAGTRAFSNKATAVDVVAKGNNVSNWLAEKRIDRYQCGAECSVSVAKLITGTSPRDVRVVGVDASTVRIVDRVATHAGIFSDKMAGRYGVSSFRPVSALGTVEIQPPISQFSSWDNYSVDLNLPSSDMRPAELYYLPSGDKQAIRVFRGNEIPGGACLLFEDGPQFVHRYDPHIFGKISFDKGEVIGKFAVRFDAKSEFIYEWRDDERPYQVGLSLKISVKGVEVRNRVLTKLVPGEWFEFEIMAPLDDKAGAWRLLISGGQAEPQLFENLQLVNKGWKHLKWFGLISNSNEISQLCVANISIGLKH